MPVNQPDIKKTKIAIVGLGYVGLPLAVAFAKKYSVVGFDISSPRISELKRGNDSTKEADNAELSTVLKEKPDDETGLYFTDDQKETETADIYIITVPTPVDEAKKPDLRPLLEATETVAKYLEKGNTVIYESTTFPGCTEEFCIPVLEKNSGLKSNSDFKIGYSPERVSPGMKDRKLEDIVKITSGADEDSAKMVAQLYESIITAGIYRAPSIKVAEAAKSIENAQRDLNISFVNELAIIFDKIGIDTNEVIDAAASKWNFLPFRPGLVGGHCISVDPYYLTYCAEKAGYYPDVIHSGRRVNDMMGSFIANKLIKLLLGKNIQPKNAKALILGITFKENCPDIRNTKVIDVWQELQDYGVETTVFDPVADRGEVLAQFHIRLAERAEALDENHFDLIILAVAHREFLQIDFRRLKTDRNILFDCKNFLDRKIVDARL